METKKRSRVDVNIDEFSVSVASILPDLAEINNYQKRMITRRYLLDMGKKILPQIYKLLVSKNIQLRKEAAKIVELMGDKESIPVLIDLLDDEDGSIRWIAAEGLVHVGRESIVPLLYKIMERIDDSYLRSGARHAFLRLFSENEKEHFRPLLLSLKNYNNISILAPLEAFRVLDILEHQYLESSKLAFVH